MEVAPRDNSPRYAAFPLARAHVAQAGRLPTAEGRTQGGHCKGAEIIDNMPA